MADYKKKFIDFAMEVGALKFGDFTLKSGRKSPYFFNSGEFKTGSELSILAEYYAEVVNEKTDYDNVVLFGPAYKGIPLATATAIKLSNNFGIDYPVSYNRKEVKDHGEKGEIIGEKLDETKNIIAIEDVITAGTAIGITKEVLASNGNAKLRAVVISVDRCEVKELGDKETAIDRIARESNIEIFPIVTIYDIAEYLGGEVSEKIHEYLKEYGAN